MHDVVIVGAGSAGCVLADRLTARGLDVAVIEAGPDLRTFDRPPSIAGESFFAALAEPGRVWEKLSARRNASSEPRTYLRGRGVGGSSAVNAMVGLWGEIDDYDSWERDHGCRGWRWSTIEPYFRRIEVPLRREDHVDVRRIGGALIETCLVNGWAQHRGPFPLAGIPADVGPASLTRDEDGKRVSAADVYLERARSRPGLTLVTGVLVDRVIIESGRARGVVLADGREVAARETVVSAGAIHSPVILRRSGIDRPGLGMNLHDHASAAFSMRLVHPVETSTLAIGAVARFSSGDLPADLQLLPVDHHGAAVAADGSQYGSLNVALMKVRSRGRVSGGTSDPTIEPVVQFDLLSDDRDMEAMLSGVNVVRHLLASRHFERATSGIYIDDAGTEFHDLIGDDDTLDQAAVSRWLRSCAGDYVHAAGTCAMGDPSAETTVVDETCRVVGVEGLRVCDASVIPDLPRANTHFPVMMIAERVADLW